MAEGEVTVRFRADTRPVLQDLENVEVQMRDIGDRAENTGAAIRRSMSAVQTGTAQARTGMTNMAGANTQINQLLLETGFVAQDAAFGFRGIANNIPGVVRSFNSARAAAGSTTTLLSSLASSITGPAGVLFATNALVGALTIASTQFDIFGGSASDSASAIDELRSKVADLLEVMPERQDEGFQFGSIQQAEEALSLTEQRVEGIGTAIQAFREQQGGLTQNEREQVRLLKERRRTLRGVAEEIQAQLDDLEEQRELAAILESIGADRAENEEAISISVQEINEAFEDLTATLPDTSSGLEAANQAVMDAIVEMERMPESLSEAEERISRLQETLEETTSDRQRMSLRITINLLQDFADALGQGASRAEATETAIIRMVNRGMERVRQAQQEMLMVNPFIHMSGNASEAGNTTEEAGDQMSDAANQISAAFNLATASIQAANEEARSFEQIASSILVAVGGILRAAGQPGAGAAVGGLGGVIGALEHGGTVRSPLQLVGESGPEIAALPRGTRVINNQETERIIERSSMGGTDRVVSELQAIQRAVKQNRLAIDAFAFQESSRTTDRLLTDAGFPPNG